MTSSYPLSWPEGWKRGQTKPRGSANRFKTDYTRTMTRLKSVLRRLKCSSYVISSNLPIKNDGMPRADIARFRIHDAGVAVYFTRDNKQMVLARDAYDSVYDNLHSVTMALEYLQGLERHGGAAMMERAFDGFVALSSEAHWRTVLGVSTACDLLEAEYRYKMAAKALANDGNGHADHEAMVKLNAAIAQAREELRE